MPAADADFLGAVNVYRRQLDLSGATDARVTCNQSVVGAAAAVLTAQYSADGSNWAALATVGVGAGTGIKTGGWAPVPSAAKNASCHVRLRGQGGDGAADPAWHHVGFETR